MNGWIKCGMTVSDAGMSREWWGVLQNIIDECYEDISSMCASSSRSNWGNGCVEPSAERMTLFEELSFFMCSVTRPMMFAWMPAGRIDSSVLSSAFCATAAINAPDDINPQWSTSKLWHIALHSGRILTFFSWISTFALDAKESLCIAVASPYSVGSCIAVTPPAAIAVWASTLS